MNVCIFVPSRPGAKSAPESDDGSITIALSGPAQRLAAEHRTRPSNDNQTIKNWRHERHLNQAYFCRQTIRSTGSSLHAKSTARKRNSFMTGKAKATFWNQLSGELYNNLLTNTLDRFREPGGTNNRFAVWDPFEKSMRYYRILLYSAALQEKEEFFKSYQKIRKSDLGRPVSVHVKGIDVNFDYLFSVQEYLFASEVLNRKDIRHVVEIGTGFGRTSHTFLELAPSIERYTIIDFPEILKLCHTYLQAVCPDLLHKVEFIDKDMQDIWGALQPDFVVTIDCFQEVPPNAIRNYMDNLIRNANYFYCKAMTGKYDPASVGLDNVRKEALDEVYSLGLYREVVDHFDEEGLAVGRRNFANAYLPGPDWEVVKEAPSCPFHFYQHVLYRRIEV
jgi:hypothetical protein